MIVNSYLFDYKMPTFNVNLFNGVLCNTIVPGVKHFVVH